MNLKKLFMLCTTILVLLVGCNKKAITAENFEADAKKSNYTVVEGNMNFEGIKSSKVATKSDEVSRIEFYEFDTTENAKNAFKKFGSEVKAKHVGIASTVDVNVGNFGVRTVVIDGMEYTTINIDNTVMYIESSESNSKDVEKMLKGIGYK